MDERLHWILSLSALGLWTLAVWAVYFFFIRHQMKDIDEISVEQRKKLLETRNQRTLKN
jgi:hypothetical protein